MFGTKNNNSQNFQQIENLFRGYAQDPLFFELEHAFDKFSMALDRNISELERIEKELDSTKYTSVN